jgi:Sec-independent protein translocase protein TatA
MLSLLALLFFGPERLPQIGARIGGWVRSLTQYSKAFMTEWSEEALVVRDAVQEVKGIRDEIVAAQAEIAGTLHTARDDVSEAVAGAQQDVRQQVAGIPSAALPPAPAGPGERSSRSATTADSGAAHQGDEAAVEKTQHILADLQLKRPKTASRTPPTPTDVKRLRSQVDSLQDEMQALRREMEAYRAKVSGAR